MNDYFCHSTIVFKRRTV